MTEVCNRSGTQRQQQHHKRSSNVLYLSQLARCALDGAYNFSIHNNRLYEADTTATSLNGRKPHKDILTISSASIVEYS